MDKAYVLDSYALMAHFEDEAGGEQVRKILKAALAGKTELFLSVINLGELYYTTLRERKREKAQEVLFLLEQLPITVVNADLEMTLEAAELKSDHPVAYADCFAAALGIRKKAKILTGDPEFRKFGALISVEWIQ
ncbi:MAG: type II toxin-antitoxin system VapC family toxin [Acidobacteria bacterium]|nr:type II toxin-antitoxin system VapC family toxin [Acidobacteriota bacterium]